MTCSLLQLVHSLEGNKKCNALAYILTSKTTLFHHFILKIPTMVSDKLFRNVEPGDNLVENEMRGCLIVGFNCGHSLCPFCEVIDSHNNMMMTPS